MWFIRNVLALMEEYHLVFATAWGSDLIHCDAAREYGRRELGWTQYNTSCAILTGSPSVFHLNTHTTKKTSAYIRCGKLVQKLYYKMFPSWVAQNVSTRDVNYKDHRERNVAVKKLDNACVAAMTFNRSNSP